MTMNYTDLIGAKTSVTSIASWVNYSKLDIQGALTDAQGVIYQSLRVRKMLKSATVTITSGNEYSTLPDRFLQSVYVRDVTNNADLIDTDWSELAMRREYSSGVITSGVPCYFSIFNNRLEFDVRASADTTLVIYYYERPAPLSGSVDTNFLTEDYPHMLRSAIMASCFKQMQNNEQYSINMAELAAYISSANAEDDLDSTSGQFLEVR